MWVDWPPRRWALVLWAGPLLIASGPIGADAPPAPAADLLEFLGAWSVEDEPWVDALVEAAAGAEGAGESVGERPEHEPEEANRDGEN
jgi:hypothetical protein